MDLKGLVKSECVNFAIQQINFGISSNDILKFFVKNAYFENLKDLSPDDIDIKEAVNLLSIDTIGFAAKDVSSGSFDGIGLDYLLPDNCLTFFVRNISYEAAVHENKSHEIETKTDPKHDPFKAARSRTAIHIPDLGVENNFRKRDPYYLIDSNIVGVSVTMIFNPDMHYLEQVILYMAGKIGVTISDVDMIDLLNFVCMFGCLYVDENNRIMEELQVLGFDRTRFKEIDDLMWKRKLELRAKKIFAATSDIVQSKTATGKTEYALQEANSQQNEKRVIFDGSIEGVVISFAKKQEVFLCVSQ